jgi:hypothetical protein
MDLQVKSDYPNIRILLDIVEMLEDLRMMGCVYSLLSRAVDEDETMRLEIAIGTIHSPALIREIRYSTNARQELELLSSDIQALLCSEKRLQKENSQDQLKLP